MKIRNAGAALLSMLLAGAMMLNLSGCGMTAKAADLMEGITAGTVSGRYADDLFIASQADFAVKLFQKTATEDENILISPLSMMLALSMTANGAGTQTRDEMETVLGGEIPLEDLNEYLYTYVDHLPSGEGGQLQLANSLWFRDEESMLTVEKDFLQTNADYYHAGVFKAPFDDRTLDEINGWVSKNTGGMIDTVLEDIQSEQLLYLINALSFEAEWSRPYTENQIADSTFTSADGIQRTVVMMGSTESRYLDDGKATGFIKNYQNYQYSFVALLPNEGVNIHDYIASLTGEGLLSVIRNAEQAPVISLLPKFSCDCSMVMNDALISLGMPSAFSDEAADFSRMGSSRNGNIVIGEVLHKTFISVDERGTKAGAVSEVDMQTRSAVIKNYRVTLDRPFVYLIIDNTLNLPIFIGATMDIQK